MRFRSTIDLWEPGIKAAIKSGDLKLQRGQWCRCGRTGKRCRFVGLTDQKSVWVTHWQGSPAETEAGFRDAVQAMNGGTTK